MKKDYVGKFVIPIVLFAFSVYTLAMGAGLLSIADLGQGLGLVAGLPFLLAGGAAFVFFLKTTNSWNMVIRAVSIGAMILLIIAIAAPRSISVRQNYSNEKTEYAVKLADKLERFRADLAEDGLARIIFISKRYEKEGLPKTGRDRYELQRRYVIDTIISEIGQEHFSNTMYKQWGSYDLAVRTTITEDGFEALIERDDVDTYLLYLLDENDNIIPND